jgi:hypothetical protein
MAAGHRQHEIEPRDVLAGDLAGPDRADIAGGDGGSPTCVAPVPAESISKACASPALSAIARNTPSAVGDRQMFAVQTKRMLVAMASHRSTALD